MIECMYVTNDRVCHFLAVGVTVEELPVSGIGTGSSCWMADLKKKYIFHAYTGQWYEQPEGSGKPGYTPVRGVDYWTEEDIAAIKEYVETMIEGGSW